MKEIEVKRAWTQYVCEICKSKSNYKSDAEKCELKCSCKHETCAYSFSADWGEPVIVKECSKCLKTWEKPLEDDSFTHEQCEEAFNR
jgi:hypothetical protein